MTGPDLGDFRWLVSCEASRYLELACSAAPSYVAITQRLRRELSPERTHLVLELAELRFRAREKFSRADQMFFTRRLLEQATEERIAGYKARRSEIGWRVIDLCCGAGGDLLGWAARGECQGLDRDPIAAEIARANASVSAVAVSVEVADAEWADVASWDAWHLDPDRRSSGHRTTQVEFSEPSLSVIEQLRNRQPTAAIKLAPAAEVPEAWHGESEREWIGSRRECRQQVAWFGNWAQCLGQCRATVIDRDGQPHSLVGSGDEPVPTAKRLDEYLLDPHAAVFAAHLVAACCERFSAAAWGPPAGYLTAAKLVESPLVAGFVVDEELPFDIRQVRAALQHRGIGRLEVKVRGVDVDPGQVLRQLSQKLSQHGDQEGVLFITGRPRHVRAVIAHRPTELK